MKKNYYQFNSVWYLFRNGNKVGPYNLRKIITMYYEGTITGTELWQSEDGKIKNFTNGLLSRLAIKL